MGQLKAKLAKLRRELIGTGSSSGGGGGLGFDVARTGIASVGFVGFPSVGKAGYISACPVQTVLTVCVAVDVNVKTHRDALRGFRD